MWCVKVLWGLGVGTVELLLWAITDLCLVLVGRTVWFCVGLSGRAGGGDGVEVGFLSWNSVQCWCLLGGVVAAEVLSCAVVVFDVVFWGRRGWWCWICHREWKVTRRCGVLEYCVG